jgi:hypothetical protein
MSPWHNFCISTSVGYIREPARIGRKFLEAGTMSMKRYLSLIMAAVFALSLAGTAIAQDAGMSNATAPAQKSVKGKKTSKKAARAKYVTGEVTAVDSMAGTITVKGRKGEVPLNTRRK